MKKHKTRENEIAQTPENKIIILSEAKDLFQNTAITISGNFLESAALHPTPAVQREGLQQLFGDVWEWTSSGYTGYPGYKPLPGALGEYNGKFMSSQVILRGGSCVTLPQLTSAPPIATSSHPPPAGSSPASAWPATWPGMMPNNRRTCCHRPVSRLWFGRNFVRVAGIQPHTRGQAALSGEGFPSDTHRHRTSSSLIRSL